jgi:CO dehydrogenase maturation factor
MRIAFVGKGGAGKSTLSAAMSLYISQQSNMPVAVFDADLNIHIPALLGLEDIPQEHHISHASVATEIKHWLIHENPIDNIGAFRKTTPPTRKSNIIKIENIKDTPLFSHGRHKGSIHAFAVGTYQTDDIGASCYHNNLSIFENILSHTDDLAGYVVADMVAGVDAFAGTLHTQFDLTVLVVEPTKRSLEVWEKYQELAKDAGIYDHVFVVGNKVRDERDANFIASHVPSEKLLGHFYDDDHIRAVDQEATTLDLNSLQEKNIALLRDIYNKTNSLPNNQQKRLEKLWTLHEKYVSQAFVKERFGDLTNQIDKDFSF